MTRQQVVGEDTAILFELLSRRAAQFGDRLAYAFEQAGDAEPASVSYAELDRQARVVGGFLQERCRPGQLALLVYPAGLEFVAGFFGCQYAGVVAVPVCPPPPNKSLASFRSIVANAEPALVLTTGRLLAQFERRLSECPELAAIPWIDTTDLDASRADHWREPDCKPSSLAVIQYTSGSTGVPKGVTLTHHNLLVNTRLMLRHAFRAVQGETGVFWLPLYHDMGLIGGMLQSLQGGAFTTFMSPLDFLQRPSRWLEAITRTRAAYSGGPNFAYELCVRTINEEQRASLDLSSWTVAVNGAEPVRQETIDRFVRTFEPCGFRRETFLPSYGMAEATLMISCGRKEEAPVAKGYSKEAILYGRAVEVEPGADCRVLVSCGGALDGHQVRIVDPESRVLCAPGRIGEIWVSGPSIAAGYYRRPEETAATFDVIIADTGEGGFMRTGDLGFLGADGELFITGRCKDLIIVAGRNHYPHDIESSLDGVHPLLRRESCAAFSVEGHDGEQLVIAIEVQPKFGQDNVAEAAAAIRAAVSEHHELAVGRIVFLKAGGIPRTTSGKPRRVVCRDDFIAGNLTPLATSQLGSPVAAPAAEASRIRAEGARTARRSAADIQDWLAERLAVRLGVARSVIDPRQPFSSYGATSIDAVALSGELERWLDRNLSPTLAYTYPTIEKLSAYLAGNEGGSSRQPAGAGTELEPIAIVGIGCRFPGAPDARAYWQNLREGVDSVTEIPPERWDADAYYHRDRGVPGKMYSRYGGFITNVDQFDPQFFGISPKEALSMDPQQRIWLEVAWEALEDAGQVASDLAGSETGVFLGISGSDYCMMQLRDPDALEPYWVTGSALSIAANRLSYFLDLKGPSLAVDTACSSSLVAVHMACESLWNRGCSLAVAGGVNLILDPQVSLTFSLAGALSEGGRCRSFAAGADGVVRSEGAGAVVLKPLARALADGDRIYALIKGSAVNHNGRTNGIVAPNQLAQESVIRDAHRRAGVSPAQIQYVEAHGTGTLLGDPIEALALGAVLAEGRPPERPCAVGSVKSNIGHAEAAAGIAGIIKTALSLRHGEIPPSLHFDVPNPHIPFDRLPLRVQTTLARWPASGDDKLAGVSAFGFGGANAHVVLAGAPARPVAESPARSKRADLNRNEGPEPAPRNEADLLVLSAHTQEALRAHAGAYRDLLSGDAGARLRDICAAACRRSHHDFRFGAVADSSEAMAKHLETFLAGKISGDYSTGRRIVAAPAKVAYVFSGHGGQWWGMGRQLREREPVFSEQLARCDELIQRLASYSILAELEATESTSRIHPAELELSQVALFALQVALVALWEHWGIRPDAVVGNSVGEVAAAHVAGALSLEDGVRIVYQRSRLMQEALGHHEERGAMALARLPIARAEEAIAGRGDRLSIAAHASPTLVVLSGQREALEEVVDSLQRQRIACRLIQTPGAGHSPYAEPVRLALERALEGLHPREETIPVFSTVTGGPIRGSQMSAAYWGRNVRNPVLLAEAIAHLCEQGFTTFLEIGASPSMTSSIFDSLRQYKRKGTVLASLRPDQDERATMLLGLAAMYTLGRTAQWPAVSGPPSRHVPLPPVPWQRQRYWFESSRRAAAGPRRKGERPGEHPLLGRRVVSARSSDTQIWDMDIDPRELSYLDDHRIYGIVILPAATYMEMALAAAAQGFAGRPYRLTEVRIVKALFFPDDEPKRVQLIIDAVSAQSARYDFFSLEPDSTPDKPVWTHHVTGAITFDEPSDVAPLDLTAIKDRCTEPMSGEDHYAEIRGRGGELGPGCQDIVEIVRRDWEALARLRAPKGPEWEAGAYVTHPALLDACFQAFAAAAPRHDPRLLSDGLFLPVGLDSLRVHTRPSGQGDFWSHVRLRDLSDTEDAVIKGDLLLTDGEGQPLIEVEGFRVQYLDQDLKSAKAEVFRTWFYAIDWERVSGRAGEAAGPPQSPGQWIIFSDRSGAGLAMRQILQTRGEQCTVVFAGRGFELIEPGQYAIDPVSRDDYRRIFDSAGREGSPPVRGVVHMWSLDTASMNGTTHETLDAAGELGCGSVAYLVQAMTDAGANPPPRLYLVTAGAQAAGEDDRVVSPAQASLWGLGKVIIFEHPELRCKVIDLSGRSEELKALHRELWADDAEHLVSLRGDETFVARLQHFPIARALAEGAVTEPAGGGTAAQTALPDLPVRSDATYLITGGLGGLGSTVARWLVEVGARHLVLLQRRAPTPEARVIIKEMEAAGAQVVVMKGDVTIEEQLEAALAEIRRSMPPLRGVVHTAAHLDDGLVINMGPERFRTVMAPKVHGAWSLHTLTQSDPLEFFVLFSSTASLLGSPGQANYSAANAFLDGLSHYRRGVGLPALSINWGPWAEVGGAARFDLGDRLTLRGVVSLTPRQGIEAFDRLLRQPSAQVAVMPVNWALLRQSYPIVASFPSLSRVLEETSSRGAMQEESKLRAQLLAAEPDARLPLLEKFLRELVSSMLRFDTTSLDIHQPLNNLGIDSLMALEIKNRVEVEFAVTIPLGKLIQNPTISQLMTSLLEQIEGSGAGAGSEGAGPEAIARARSPIVPIQPEGSKPPFFCVHPIEGDVLHYADLARRLGREQPLYGLRAVGLDGEDEPLSRLEDIAARYNAALLEIQPDGPYMIGGHSIGGIIGFEMAHQLRALGKEVALLVLIDSPCPIRGADAPEIDSGHVLASIVTVGGVFGAGMDLSYEDLKGLSPDEQFERVVARGRETGSLPNEAVLERVRRIFGVCLANLRAVGRYDPRVYPGPTSLIRGSELGQNLKSSLAGGVYEWYLKKYEEPDMGWGKLVCEPLDIHRIPGNHFSIFTEPHIQLLAATLGERLDRTTVRFDV
jgi:acyl transferase domain-containing protein/acyl-CoA synthetase (AMP-forming)/AMP-acid ligase II/thioesterase domain-containing protein/acyl carrier protein